MSDALSLLDGEAAAVSVQAVPGAVFLRLKRDQADGGTRRMFIELTVHEAVVLRREPDCAIGLAAATR